MAERNPSKQRRQAQNRAAREARKARSVAANTPVEERRPAGDEADDDRRTSRRRRRRALSGRDEVRAKARSVIEAEAVESDEDSFADDDFDDENELDDEVVEEPTRTSVTAGSGRRGSSPVFSSRHRAAVASATADRAPARTHLGVAEATGTEVATPRAVATTRPVPTRSNNSRSGSSKPSVTAANRTAGSAPQRSSTSTGGPRTARTSSAASRTSNRPPAKPLPAFFDRFGGNEPGGRWVMMSFATVLLASVVLNFFHIVPEFVENAKGDQVRTGRSFTIWHFGVGPALYYLLPPIVILGLFIVTARPWDRRRSWNFALALLTFSTLVTGLISVYVIPIALLAWGCWQARKAALDDVGGDPRVLREVERERRIAHKEAMRTQRAAGRSSD